MHKREERGGLPWSARAVRWPELDREPADRQRQTDHAKETDPNLVEGGEYVREGTGTLNRQSSTSSVYV